MKLRIITPRTTYEGTVIRNNKISYTMKVENHDHYKGTMKIFKKWLEGIDVPEGYKVEVVQEHKKQRYITSGTYERAMKRTEKAVLRNMGY